MTTRHSFSRSDSSTTKSFSEPLIVRKSLFAVATAAALVICEAVGRLLAFDELPLFAGCSCAAFWPLRQPNSVESKAEMHKAYKMMSLIPFPPIISLTRRRVRGISRVAQYQIAVRTLRVPRSRRIASSSVGSIGGQFESPIYFGNGYPGDVRSERFINVVREAQ